MPYKIVEKERLNAVTWRVRIEAPYVAQAARAGQFVVIRIDEVGERIPLTINDSDPARKAVTIVFQEAGTTTKKLGLCKAGDSVFDLLGPLGRATDFGAVGSVALVAGGVGIAEVLPIAKYAKANGNFVLSIIGARTKELLILETEVRSYSDDVVVATDDGSYGLQGLVIAPLRDALAKRRFGLCYSVGPDIMMKAVCETTKPFGLKTIVSLDANMVDATGMCGTCRVVVGGETRFACVDGPEFDGHRVDWDNFLKRQKRFAPEEQKSLDLFKARHTGCMYKG